MKRMTRCGLGLLAALAFTALPLPSATASAASRDGVCDVGEFCVYQHDNRTGYVFDTTGPDTDYSNNTYPGSPATRVEDTASSVWNRDNCTIRVWQHPGRGGVSQTFAVGRIDGNLSDNTIGDNRISGHACA